MKQVMRCLFGSHMYGLETPNSDKDYKGIYLPERSELLLGNYKRHYSESTGDDKSKNTKDDVDIEVFSLPYFIELACKGETVAIDMLHANRVLPQSFGVLWHDLVDKRKMFYTKDMKSYVGYARKQANRYGIKGSRMGAVEEVRKFLLTQTANHTLRSYWDELPLSEFLKKVTMEDKSQGGKPLHFYEICGRKYQDTLFSHQLYDHMDRMYDEYGERAKLAKENNGVDWKAVSHSLRASYQMLGILKDGDFEYPLPQTKFLLNVKQGKLDFVTEVQPELERVIQEIEALAEVSNLPAKVDHEFWDNWLLAAYEKYL